MVDTTTKFIAEKANKLKNKYSDCGLTKIFPKNTIINSKLINNYVAVPKIQCRKSNIKKLQTIIKN